MLTKIFKYVSAIIVVLIFLIEGASVISTSWAQSVLPLASGLSVKSTPPDGERAAALEVSVVSQQKRIEALENDNKELSEKIAMTVAEYSASRDALKLDRELFKSSMSVIDTIVKWVSFLILALSVGITFFVGKSLRDLQKDTRETVLIEIEKELRKTNGQGLSLTEISNKTTEALTQLGVIKEKLSGYTALADVAEVASKFDPLSEYFALIQEISTRSDNDQLMARGDKKIEMSSTTGDANFRQSAATIFERLLRAVKEGESSGKPKIDTNTLYNMSANASKAGLNFVALELMEVAEKQKSMTQEDSRYVANPEITSRLIRQRLTMSRISSSDASKAMADLLKKTQGYDMHLVVAEAFNVGIHSAQPGAMAKSILKNLPDRLNESSYAQIIAARLFSMGSNDTEWTLSRRHFKQAFATFQQEPKSTRWHESALEDINLMVQEDPTLLESL